MIKYRLLCKNCDLQFDSWFASSSEYEKLKKKKLLNCHKCNSFKVEKTIMAPQLINNNSKNNYKKVNIEKYNKIKKTIIDYQKFIKDNFKYVGDNFAYEARSIHYNKKRTRGIYGKASNKDIRELKEEGIKAQIVPWIDDNEN